MRIQIFILTLCLAFQAKAKNYIVGGSEVGPLDPIASSTVGIFSPSPDGSGSLCTGSLIGKDIAVTAAHCIPSGKAKPWVIFGRDLHSPEAIHRESTAVSVNPRWQKGGGSGMDQGDIALVKFRGALPQGYRRVPTLNSDHEIESGENVTLAGYGINNARTKMGAGRLRKTQVRVANPRTGKPEMILDQSRGRGACHGDSGGPAFIKEGRRVILAGVTNRGYPDSAPDDCGHQVVYTKLPAYRSWIQKSERRMTEARQDPILARNTHLFRHKTLRK